MNRKPGFEDDTQIPPFETHDLRKQLKEFLDTEIEDPISKDKKKIGNYKFGVYAFFDYDGEPIYVGQTNELLRTRIRRHLTNQRTDAVAMSVLDPFEVYEIEVWPLPQFEKSSRSDLAAKKHLDALEYLIFQNALKNSEFSAILNEIEPKKSEVKVSQPKSFRRAVVSDEVYKIRSHPDFRIARRASTIARLAQRISERQVQVGLRQTLVTQAKRLLWLAERRSSNLSDKTKDQNNND